MIHNFNLSLTANLDQKTVEEILIKVLEEQTGRKVSRVEIKLKTVQKGDQRESWEVPVFEGYTVHFATTPLPSANPLYPHNVYRGGDSETS